MSIFHEKILGPIVEEAIKSIITDIPGCSQNFNAIILIDTIINRYNKKSKQTQIDKREYLINQIESNRAYILHTCRLKDIKEKIMKICMNTNV
jgi:hypothetical protein